MSFLLWVHPWSFGLWLRQSHPRVHNQWQAKHSTRPSLVQVFNRHTYRTHVISRESKSSRVNWFILRLVSLWPSIVEPGNSCRTFRPLKPYYIKRPLCQNLSGRRHEWITYRQNKTWKVVSDWVGSNCILAKKYVGPSISFQTFLFEVFKIVVVSWKFTMLLLYILWDDWPVFMFSRSNKQLRQESEYTLLKPDCHSWWILKVQSGREDILEERYAIKLCFKLGKNTTETYGMLQTAFRPSCMNRASVFE